MMSTNAQNHHRTTIVRRAIRSYAKFGWTDDPHFRDHASMGPRSRERGNPVGPDLPRSATQLQWGRAHASAEMSISQPECIWFCVASMGPRSRERGNFSVEEVCDGSPRASTGPRSRERGNGVALCATILAEVAASMGPRSRERGNKFTSFNHCRFSGPTSPFHRARN